MLDRPYREPPCDIDLEQAILGAVLVANANLDRLSHITPADFYDPVHQAVFAGMVSQWSEARAVNVATLRAALSDIPRITEQLSPTDYIRKLIGLGDASNLDALAAALRELSSRRALCELAVDLDLAARDLAIKPGDTAARAVVGLDLALATARGRRVTRSNAYEAFRDAVESVMNDTGADRIPSGLASFDKATGGWRRQQFAILAGRPSMGKSTIATSAMIGTARAGHGVLMFSLEMPRHALALRCLSDLAWSHEEPIPYADAMAQRLSPRAESKLGQTAAHFGALPLVIDDQGGLTMAEIAARTRAEAQRFERDGKRLGLVIVDHLGLIRPSGRYAGNKVQEVGEISHALACLAKEQDVAVLALNQLNRGTEGRENKRPTLADLRNSGDLEQDADLVCFAYRQSYYLERMKCDPGSQAELQRETELEGCRNTLEVLIAKNRNGPTTTVPLFCDMASNVVRDLA